MAVKRDVFVDIKGDSSSAKKAIAETTTEARKLENSLDKVDEAAAKNAKSMNSMGGISEKALKGVVREAQNLLSKIPYVGESLSKGLGGALKSISSDAAAAEGALGGAASGSIAAAAAALGLVAALAALVVAYVAVGVVIAAIGKALFDFTLASAQQVVGLQDAADATHFAASEMSAYNTVLASNGKTLHEGVTAITTFEKKMADAAAGNKELAKTFDELGIDTKRGLEHPRQAFDQFLIYLGQMKDDGAKTALVQKLLGEGAVDLQSSFADMSNGLGHTTEELRAMGLVIDDTAANKASAFMKSFNRMGEIVAFVGVQLGTEFYQPFIEIMDGVGGFLAANMGTFRTWASTLASLIQWNVDNLKSLLSAAQAVNSFFGGSSSGTGIVAKSELRGKAGQSLAGTGGIGRIRGGGAGGGAGNAANEAAAIAKQNDALDAKDAQALYRDLTAAIKTNFDQRVINQTQYVEQMIAEEKRLETKLLEIEYRKMGEVEKLTNPAKRDVEMRALNEATMSITENANKRIAEIQETARTKEFAALVADNSQSVNAMREGARERQAVLQQSLDAGLISRKEAAESALAIELQLMDIEKGLLEGQLARQKGHREAEDAISRQLGALKAQRGAVAAVGAINVSKAAGEDLAATRAWSDRLRGMWDDVANNQRDFEQQRIDLMRGAGASRKQILAAEVAFERTIENEQNARNVRDLQIMRDTTDLRHQSAQEKADFLAAINAGMESEATRHALAMQAIDQKANSESFFNKFKAFKASIPTLAATIHDSFFKAVNGIGDIFANAVTQAHDGIKGLLKDIGADFAQLMRQILAEILKLLVVKGVMSVFSKLFGIGDPSGGGGGGKSGGKGGILSSILSIFRGGGAAAGGGGGAAAAATGAAGVGSMATAGAGAAAGLGIGIAGLGGGGAAAASGMASGLGAGVSGGAAGGGGLMGSMGALFTNPWTAVVAGGIVASILLWKHFSNRTEKKLREAVQSTYGVQIKDMAVLKQIKEVGEQAFGKGQVSKHLLDTVKLDGAKTIIQGYAESTGQTASKLVTEAQLKDPSWAGNQMIRREFGGPVRAGVPYIVGERRPEVFVPESNGMILPSVPGRSGAGSQGSGAGGGAPNILIAALVGAVQSLSDQVAKLKAIAPNEVVAMGAGGASVQIAHAAGDGMEKSASARRKWANKTGT